MAARLSRRLAIAIALVLQAQEPTIPVGSLKGIAVPEPPNLSEFVRDRKLAVVLGKTLFWDMQTGTDGVQACASCHFHAGADSRSRNQVSPAVNKLGSDWLPSPGTAFSVGGAPNYELKPSDFPFHKLSDPNNRNSVVTSDADAIVSSQGVHRTEFIRSCDKCLTDVVRVVPDPMFNVNGINVRQVPGRSAPSVINAVFNFRQYWDGRAQNVFNGVNHWGDRDPGAQLLTVVKGVPTPVTVRIPNASLASQAVAPPTNTQEFSASGRDFAEIGAKFISIGKKDRDVLKNLLGVRPLGRQLVALDDSILGPYSQFPLRGLRGDGASYATLIQKAFRPEWWDSKMRVVVRDNGSISVVSEKEAARHAVSYTLMEYNFSLFFGLAVQLYESTLVSDDTPFDRYKAGDSQALNAQEQRGLALFSDADKVRCVNCHGGPEFTNASVSHVSTKPVFRRSKNLIDTGFNNIGLRPTREDPGVGRKDPWGNSRSEARRFSQRNPSYNLEFHGPVATDGAFKTPGLRNVELTAPYFHTGSMLTLDQVIDFYARGGDFQPIESSDGNSISPLSTLNLQPQDKKDLVAFLKALTDERVRYHRAPFDHPELLVPDGQLGDTQRVFDDTTGKAIDRFRWLPPVGRKGLLTPLPNFLQ